jgi:hypothetical protein
MIPAQTSSITASPLAPVGTRTLQSPELPPGGTTSPFIPLPTFEARENTIRAMLKKWFGPLEILEPVARRLEIAHREACLGALLRLHRLGWNLVSEKHRTLFPEEDVQTALMILNRLVLTFKCPLEEIVDYCETHIVRETNLRALQMDPLQLRHLLTFHQEIPHRELNAGEIHQLRTACENNDEKAVRDWFSAIARKKEVLPRDTAQYLRHLLHELLIAGHKSLDLLATELCVLEVRMLDVIGWENGRQFFSLVKRIHGTACTSLKPFLDYADIGIALRLYRHLKMPDEVLHFRALMTAFEANDLNRLESIVQSTARERNARAAATAAPFSATQTASPMQPKPTRPSLARYQLNGSAA